MKAELVIQGLQGSPVAEWCHEYPISQPLYDQWCDRWLANAARTVEVPHYNRQEARLVREDAKLNTRVSELILERKQSDEGLG